MHGIFILYRVDIQVAVLFDQPENAKRERTRRRNIKTKRQESHEAQKPRLDQLAKSNYFLKTASYKLTNTPIADPVNTPGHCPGMATFTFSIEKWLNVLQNVKWFA